MTVADLVGHLLEFPPLAEVESPDGEITEVVWMTNAKGERTCVKVR